MSKTQVDNGIRAQFTAANRIVTQLSKFSAAQRARIMDIVNEHKFDDAPKVPENQEEMAFS